MLNKGLTFGWSTMVEMYQPSRVKQTQNPELTSDRDERRKVACCLTLAKEFKQERHATEEVKLRVTLLLITVSLILESEVGNKRPPRDREKV